MSNIKDVTHDPEELRKFWTDEDKDDTEEQRDNDTHLQSASVV